jgi:hypothetical protein
MLRAEKDKLIGQKIYGVIYSGYGKDCCKSINMFVDIVTKDVTYVVNSNHKVILTVSDLDIAIEKFNEL